MEEIHDDTQIDMWFLNKINNIVVMEKAIAEAPVMTKELMQDAKRMEFPDTVIARLRGQKEEEVRNLRYEMGITAHYKIVDTCAAEFDAETPYFYSTYESAESRGCFFHR